MTYISVYRLVQILTQMVRQEMPSEVYNLSHRKLSSLDLIDAMKELYPELETIFVDQHIPLHDLTIACDPRLEAMMPNDTTMVEDLKKFQELFTF